MALLPMAAIGENIAITEPVFSVLSRQNKFEFFPCADCHNYIEPSPIPRYLPEAPHFPELKHGNADIWCTTCHTLDNREQLRLLSGKLIEFDQGYLVCGQCHESAFRDWRFGAHGKRVKQWQGDRVIYNCAECHNPHVNPGIQPRPPQPPPGVRVQHTHQHQKRTQLKEHPGLPNNPPSSKEASNVAQ